jgi:hypothetical protein
VTVVARLKVFSLLVFLAILGPLFGEEELCGLGLDPCTERMFRDLERVHQIDREIHDRLPLILNYQLQGGYFTMPSARTYEAGMLGFGFAYVPPYNVWSLAFQFFDHLETTGNYWIYNGKLEGNFGHLGFGDDAERAANVKFILLRKEDGIPFLPEFAIGWNDFIGSCRFNSFYAVATQDFLKLNLEATLGWGNGRIKGFFGGLAWSPWRHSPYFWKGLTLAAEYDANNYKHHVHEHSEGRKVSSRINAGVQYEFLNFFRASASTIRGNDWAASLAFKYNLGESKGLFPKIYDPLPYQAPIDQEALGIIRSREEFAQELAYAFKEQGLDLFSIRLVPENGGEDRLWMKLVNIRYRIEEDVRNRIERVLGSLIPSNVKTVTAVVEADGVDVHEYRFRSEDLKRYCEEKMGEDEFRVIAPTREVTRRPNDFESCLLYKRHKPIWILTFRPWLRTFFGSSTGKIKYETGLSAGPEGYLFDQIYYSLYATWTIKSSVQKLADRDALNPSRIINVRTDTIRYNQANSFHIDQAFLQKSWNMGHGWFSRLAVGYFEMAYSGIAAETLYYPVRSSWAIGFEAATLLKRNYYGLGFQHKIRKLTDEGYKLFPYTGLQYFVDFYYEYKPFNLDFKVSVGQFLARDQGIRVEGARMFPSGLRVGLWYTLTNANDVVNGSRYYDKGFSITMPLDMFMNKSSRTRIGYSMSAWLRDCGAIAATGKELYKTLYWERYNPKPVVY